MKNGEEVSPTGLVDTRAERYRFILVPYLWEWILAQLSAAGRSFPV